MGKDFRELKAYRARLGLTQEDVASMIDTAKCTYTRKENGQISFYLNEMFLITEGFNKLLQDKNKPLLTIDELFARD